MANWSILYGNDEVNISDRNPYDLVSISGIGTAPLRQLEERSPFQDGSSSVGFRLDPRIINLVLFMNSSSRAEADNNRTALYEYFKGLPLPLKLKCIKDNGDTRLIDCYTSGMVDAPLDEQNRVGASQRFAIQLKALNPIWYDQTPLAWGILGGSSTGASGFSIPMEVPFVQAPNTFIDATVSLSYSGSWYEYPVITIFGPGTNFTVTNLTTGDILDFPTLVLTSGEYVQIDLRYGAKSVVDDTGANVIGELSSDSDLSTWRLVPSPIASSGANSINFSVASDATEETGVRINYYNRYTAL